MPSHTLALSEQDLHVVYSFMYQSRQRQPADMTQEITNSYTEIYQDIATQGRKPNVEL